MSAASVAVVVTSGERSRRKGRHGVICRQKRCDPCLSALSVPPWPKKRYINTLPFLFLPSLKITHSTPSRVGIWTTIKHPSLRPKRHLDRFSCFCRDHDRDRPTDRQTDHATPSVTIGRIYVVGQLRCGLIIQALKKFS